MKTKSFFKKLFIISAFTIAAAFLIGIAGTGSNIQKAHAQFGVSLSVANATNVTLTSDFTVTPKNRGIWVGTGGTVRVDMYTTGTGIYYYNVPSGTTLPYVVSKVYSTANGTTASNLVILY